MHNCTHSRVEQVDVTPEVLACSTLARVDYADAFVLRGATRGEQRTALAWARRTLESAPMALRASLVSGWTAIGLDLRLRDPGAVLGWPVRRCTDRGLLLAADSRIGMPGELSFRLVDDELRFSTFVHQGNLAARTVWAGVEPVHAPMVRRLLELAGADDAVSAGKKGAHAGKGDAQCA